MFEEQTHCGVSLDETTIKSGLQELNSSIHFDMLTNVGQWHPHQESRQGVWYEGRHISSMDRLQSPEFKIWSVEQGVVEIDPVDADKYDDGHCVYVEILPTDRFYSAALEKAEKNDDRFTLDNGKVLKWSYFRMMKKRGIVMRLGWRHVFEKLVRAKIPGVTRDSLALKFNVDMYKYPVGAPEEVEAALNAE